MGQVRSHKGNYRIFWDEWKQTIKHIPKCMGCS